MTQFRVFLFLFLLGLSGTVRAQVTYPVNGTTDPQHEVTVLANAIIHVDHETIIDKGHLLIKDGRIYDVYADTRNMPKAWNVIDLRGHHIYPSFIELDSDIGMPKAKKGKRTPGRSTQLETKTKGAFGWNQSIRPEVDAARIYRTDTAKARKLREMGFGAALTHQHDGVMRGTGAVVALTRGKENRSLLKADATSHYSFQKGTSKQRYPTSLMGAIALIKQTYYDAEWYANAQSPDEYNLSLQSFLKHRDLPVIFTVRDYQAAIRADKIGDEFEQQFVFRGAGDEYQQLDQVVATGGTFIVPLTFPKAFDVEDPFDAMMVSMEQMKHWELAPANAARLAEAGVEFAFTGHGLKTRKELWAALNKAVKYGLSDTMALKALTTVPARILGVEEELGSLHKGKWANLIVTKGSLFSGGTLKMNWVKGQPLTEIDRGLVDVRGEYDLNINSKVYSLSVKGAPRKLKATIKSPEPGKTADATVSTRGDLVSVSFEINDQNFSGTVRLSGKVSFGGGLWDGQGQLSTGEWVSWNAIQKEKWKPQPKPLPMGPDSLGPVWYPNVAYGRSDTDTLGDLLIRNATIWTNTDLGILQETDVLIRNGKIARIGTGLAVEGSVTEIDAAGKNLTPGLIDEHSHIAIHRGVNESSSAITAEVYIGDVINARDVNIYRQLAGGVTASQLLHGSANPIGGRSGLVKLRWGLPADSLLIKDAPGFIKFALGENVKQSNWSGAQPKRFPQTRMGIEQVYYDGFIRAREYDAQWEAFNGLKKKEKARTLPPRRDVRLEVLAEILKSQRFITCHSYVQSEINMLMHVADSMGFTVNTFTHILEGYKVADKMREHGVAASTFADWWAYKFEVNDAIPYNAAILHEQGVLTAINSDDAEMGRRLNQEAAKAVKYGGVSEEEALKMVTLNPARMLHLDDRMGSVEVGKDADLVLWTDHPLSIYAKPEKTLIDGKIYFDLDRDQRLRDQMVRERERLIRKMQAAKKAGEKTQRVRRNQYRHYHCDTEEEP